MNSIATNWRKAFLALFLLAGLSLFASDASAQGRVANYSVSTFTGFTSIGGGSFGSGGDNLYLVSLPFNFNYDNTSYTAGSSVRLTTNGWLQFSGASTQYSYYNAVGNSSHPSTICFGSNDMFVATGFYQVVTGTSPNRVWTIEAQGFRGYGYSNTTAVQLKLYETTNVIEVLYRDYNYYLGPVFGIGLNGATSPSFSINNWYASSNTPPSNVRFTPPIPPGHQLSVSPKSHNFGSIVAGTNATDIQVTVRNAGITTNLVINSANISGNTDFTIVSSPASNTYAPGQSGTYTLRFNPQASGTRNASFNVVSNGLDSGSQSVNLIGVGIAPQVAYEEVTSFFRKTRTRLGEMISASTVIRSTGNGPLTVTSVTIDGEFANNYQITRMPATTLPVGTLDTITVSYVPVEEGLRAATLNIRTNAIQNPNKSITLSGLGILPHLSITPTAIHFDSVGMGDTAWTTMRLYNSGSDTLAVRADYVTFADKDFAYFGLEGADSLIAPEKFRDVMVRFTPTVQGARQGRVRFLTNIPMTFETIRRDTSVFVVDVTGTSVPYGLLSFTAPTAIDSAIIGTETCQTVGITNNGPAPLTISSATIVGQDASDFTLTGVTFPLTVAPMSTVNAQVCGTPSARGLRTAMVDVVSVSKDRTTNIQLPLVVYGLAVCAQPSTTVAFENEIVPVGTTSTAQIQVNNCGDVATSYTAALAGTGYTLTSAAVSPLIAPGDNHTYEVSFNPATMAPLAGTLTVTGEVVTTMVVNLGGIGGGAAIAATNTNAPNTPVGVTSAAFTVSVQNTGNMELTPGAPTVTGSEFAFVSGPSTIAAGASADYTFTFTPSTEGTRNATVSFPSASPVLQTPGTFTLSGVAAPNGVRQTAQNGYSLEQNYPNPVNGTSTITFTMAEGGNAQIVISDVTGKVVTTVADQYFTQGTNKVSFDGANLTSGTYFYELVTGGVRLQRSMLLSK